MSPVAPGAIRARPGRTEPQQLVGAPPQPALPTVRLWPFAAQETAGGDRRIASPILFGPVIVDQMFMVHTDDSNAPDPTLSMWYGPTVLPSGNAVANVGQLGTPMFTDGVITEEVAGTYQSPIQHIPIYSFSGGPRENRYEMRFLIQLERCQILLQFGTSGAGSRAVAGYVRILERVPPELIPNFL